MPEIVYSETRNHDVNSKNQNSGQSKNVRDAKTSKRIKRIKRYAIFRPDAC